MYSKDSYDQRLQTLIPYEHSTGSMCGIGGVSEIIPIRGTHSLFGGYFYTRDLMNTFYYNIWECRKVCDVYPDLMAQSWGTFNVSSGDRLPVDLTNEWIDGLSKKYKNGQMLANRHGGATYIRLVDDGRKLDEPIDLDNIKSVRYSRLLDRWECYPDHYSYQIDPTNPLYYLINVNPVEQVNMLSYVNSTELEGDLNRENQGSYYMRIHRDRVLRFDGAFMDTNTLEINQGWHCSALIAFLPSCLRYLEAMGYVAGAMKSFEMVLFMVDDLFNLLESPAQAQKIKNRARINQEMLNSVRAMMADRKHEDVKIVSRNFSNVDKNIEIFMNEMIGASDLDRIELFQEHPKGMQQTGQSQRMEKARKVKGKAKDQWGDNLKGNLSDEKIGDLQLFLLSDESPFNSPPVDYGWEWNSNVEVTPSEASEIYQTFSQGDKNYKESGCLSAEEIRTRFGGDIFKDNIILSAGLPEDPTMKSDELKNKSVELSQSPKKSEDAVTKLTIEESDNILLDDSFYDTVISQIDEEI